MQAKLLEKAIVLAGGMALILVAGCASKNYRDIPADERGKMIHDHLEEGRILMLSPGEDANDLRRIDDTLEIFHEAREHFEEALELDKASGSAPSAKPRIMLGNCLHLIATVHQRIAEAAREEIARLKEAKRAVPAKVQVRVRENEERAKDFAARSNTILLYYRRFLATAYPERGVLESIGGNYQILGEWEKAAATYRTLIRELRLTKSVPAYHTYQRLVRICQEKAVEALDEGL